MYSSMPPSSRAARVRLTRSEPRARTGSIRATHAADVVDLGSASSQFWHRSPAHGPQLHSRRPRVPQARARVARAESAQGRSPSRGAPRVASQALRRGLPGHGLAQGIRRRRRPAHGAGHRGRRDGASQRARTHQRPGAWHRGTDHRGARHRGAEDAVPQEDPHRGGALVPALLRAQRGLRPCRAPDLRGGRGRSLRRQRAEDLDERRRYRRLGPPPRAHRHEGAQAQGHLLLPHEHAPARGGRAPAQADHGLLRVLRGLHDQRARGEKRSDRQTRRGLGHRPDDAGLRARRPGPRARHHVLLAVQPADGSGPSPAPSRQASPGESRGAPEARAYLVGDRGGALSGPAHSDPARARGASGGGRFHHQALVLGVREALHGAGPGDPGALRPADPGRAAGLRPRHRHGHRRARELGLRLSVVARGHHLRRILGDPEERDRRAHPRPAEGDPRGPGGRQGVNFSFSDDQILLRNSVRSALEEQCKPEHVRAMFDDPRGYGEALWGEMAKLGWLGLPFTEEQGGAGLGLVELAIVLEEMGRAAYPGPFFATVVLGGLGIQLAGNAAQKDRWLSAISAGQARATAALLEEHLDWDPASTTATATPDGAGWKLSGVKRFVPWAHVADMILVPVRAPEGVSLFLVDPKSAGVTLSPMVGIDLANRSSEVRLDKVAVGSDAVLGAPGAGQSVLDSLLRRGAVMASAEMLGAARRCLDMSVSYVKVREQFGQPVGSFQAIRHRCSEMLLEAENAHAAVYYAAWALAAGAEDAAVAASICKAYVSDAARKVCGDSIQVHGGIGFTWEYDLHLYMKRAKALEPLFGDAEFHRELIVRHLTSAR